MVYMERRRTLVDSLARHLGDTVELVGAEAGMHLVALLSPDTDDVEVSKRAAQANISAMALSGCYLETPRRGGLILGYGGVNTRLIQGGVRKLKAILRPELVCDAGVQSRSYPENLRSAIPPAEALGPYGRPSTRVR